MTNANLFPMTERQIEARLKELYVKRAERINAFWALCQDFPQEAMIQCEGSQLKRDVWLLAQKRAGQSRFLTIDPPLLSTVTDKVREVFEREGLTGLDGHQWGDALLVGVFAVGEKIVQVHRFSMGPFYHNEGDSLSWIEGDDWFLRTASWTVQGGPDEDELRAYTLGIMDDENQWQPAQIGDAERDRIGRLIDSTQRLAKHGVLKSDAFDTNPFTEFPCEEDVEIAQLVAQRHQIFLAGRRSEASREALRTRLAPLRQQIDALRAQERELESQRKALEDQALEVESLALEEETGVRRGDTIRHKETEKTGVVSIMRNGNATFYLDSDRWRGIEDEIRRGEWEVVKRSEDMQIAESGAKVASIVK